MLIPVMGWQVSCRHSSKTGFPSRRCRRRHVFTAVKKLREDLSRSASGNQIEIRLAIHESAPESRTPVGDAASAIAKSAGSGIKQGLV
jgi:hypothetical protein